MKKIRAACVYCGSSKGNSPEYENTATQLGKQLAKNSIKMVYGGGTLGLMGFTANACMDAGGNVIGVTTTYLDRFEGGHKGITELHRVETMHERKLMMFEHSDAFIILPGGLGTLDELFEILTWKQIGLHGKPVVLINLNGYWNHVVELINGMVTNGFVRSEDRDIFYVASNVDEAIEYLNKPLAKHDNFVSKWA